jgi:undecaprenyldiphospho-muramoylpentapeptide beta-N-acetylglucosaminyltransferase
VRILISGGGTGGHIYPALAVVAELRKKKSEYHDYLWIGIKDEIEEILVPREDIQLMTIEGGGLVGISWPKRLENLARLGWSTRSVSNTMKSFEPDVLFMTGGYVNLPVATVAKTRGIPSLIYVPDIEPALSIKTLSRLATTIACTAEESTGFFPKGKSTVTGYPVRSDIRAATGTSHSEALDSFDLEPERQTIFVFGGSRGARSINRALMSILPAFLVEHQVIHITGSLDWPEIEEISNQMAPDQRKHYRPFAYLHERMGSAFRAADLVVARAGASILGECPAFALPAILVPYPYAWRYQKVNADYLVRNGAAVCINDDELPERLLATIEDLLSNRDKLQAMSAASESLNTPESAAKLADLLLDLRQRNFT